VLFGSNYPMLTAAACLEGLHGLGLGAEEEARFLYQNAGKVFGISTS